MDELGRMVMKFQESCRRTHELLSEGNFSRGWRSVDRMSVLSKQILASGEKGREMLFLLAEGEDLPVALHAANCIYPYDPKRCKRALKAITRRDNGFFAYSARFMIKHRHKSMETLLSEMRERTRRMLARARPL
ncbi:MAG: hypothetical protein JW807_17590 [Spirochaetes bacterium]|nr:hypothetical protein [Spirochaetota bacterium]